MRRPIIAALVALLAVLLAATPALAVFTVHQEARTERRSFQLGDPFLGEVHDVQALNFYEDQNDSDSRDDFVRAGDRFTKIFAALRIQIDFVRLQIRCDNGTWLTMRSAGLVNSGTARQVVANTPAMNLDESATADEFDDLYRVQAGKSVRWANTGRLSRWVETSNVAFDQAPRDAADLARLVSTGCQP